MRAIAVRLDKAPSTVSREIARNGGRTKYRAARADERAWARAKRPKAPILTRRPALRKVVAANLQDDWSPEQIAGWLAAKYRRGSQMRVSNETIYRSLYLRTRSVLHRQLIERLRTKRTMRKGKRASTKGQRGGQIIDAVHSRSTRRDRGSDYAWTLGRRPDHRAPEHAHGDARRAIFSVPPARVRLLFPLLCPAESHPFRRLMPVLALAIVAIDLSLNVLMLRQFNGEMSGAKTCLAAARPRSNLMGLMLESGFFSWGQPLMLHADSYHQYWNLGRVFGHAMDAAPNSPVYYRQQDVFHALVPTLEWQPLSYRPAFGTNVDYFLIHGPARRDLALFKDTLQGLDLTCEQGQWRV